MSTTFGGDQRSRATACDSCRQGKKKCTKSHPASKCDACLVSNKECVTNYVRKTRGGSIQKNIRAAEFDARVRRLESLLEQRTSVQLRLEEQPFRPADQLVPLSSSIQTLRDEVSTLPCLSQNELPDTTPMHANMSVEPGPPGHQLSQESITDSPARPNCNEFLPHPELGSSLLAEFLVDFNTAVPLYRPYIIADHIKVCYEGGSDMTHISWASTFVVLGIAYKVRAMSATSSPEDDERADFYCTKLLRMIPDLILAPPSLPLIQCLLGLAVLHQSSYRSSLHTTFVSISMRMAQSLAYNDSDVTSQYEDLEQQHRVFWIAFIMDVDQSILSNTPTTHHRQDIGTSVPSEAHESAAGAIVAAEGGWSTNIFALRSRLSLLQAEAIDEVFSVRARRGPLSALLENSRALLEALRNWRSHELFRLEVPELVRLLYRSDIVHVVTLEASYFATVFRLSAVLVLESDPRNPFVIDVLRQLANRKEQPAYTEGRRFLELLSVAPQGDIGLWWSIKIPVVAALTTVLSHTLYNSPIGQPLRSELEQYGKIVAVLSQLTQKCQDPETRSGRDLCATLLARNLERFFQQVGAD